MKVVCNSSPLVNLSRIGRLYILKQLYTELLIPEAVYQEVVINGEGMPGAYEVSCSDWITTRDIKDQRLVRVLSYDLDLGESEAIVLAIQENAELLVIKRTKGHP